MVHLQFVRWLSPAICHLLPAVERDPEDNTEACHAYESFTKRAESNLRQGIVYAFE